MAVKEECACSTVERVGTRIWGKNIKMIVLELDFKYLDIFFIPLFNVCNKNLQYPRGNLAFSSGFLTDHGKGK